MTMPHYASTAFQKFQSRFQFRKARIKKAWNMGTPNGKAPHDGSIQIELYINDTNYGPYSTGIFTFRDIWEGRLLSRMSRPSQDLIDQLAMYRQLVQQAYDELCRRGGPVDGQQVINAAHWIIQQKRLPNESIENSPFEVVTLKRVYNEFLQYKRTCIQPDRRKRTLDQISDSTYETYPRRWVLVQEYLSHLKRQKLPVSAVTYPFATSLKEWLQCQCKVNGERYDIATVNKVISLLKQLTGYALSKGYLDYNPLQSFSCRGGSPANPKPLREEQLNHLENCDLPPTLRRVCDSWLVAAELCLHYSDFIELPNMKIIVRPGGQRYIQHDRAKQTGSQLKQTVNITPRAERLIEKWGGIQNLYYKSDTTFSKSLKKIAQHANLRDDEDRLIGLQFGQGRDSGLTMRAIEGANNTELSRIGGWSKAVYANRYIGNEVDIVDSFVKRSKQ